jgi:hypothetical protein
LQLWFRSVSMNIVQPPFISCNCVWLLYI